MVLVAEDILCELSIRRILKQSTDEKDFSNRWSRLYWFTPLRTFITDYMAFVSRLFEFLILTVHVWQRTMVELCQTLLCRHCEARTSLFYGDGKQTRSFQYVSDLIEGMIRMMASSDEFLGPVNIGNPGEFTMLELAEKVIAMTDSKSKIVFRPLPSDDPKMRRPDITLAKAKLDWEPKVKLDEGLAKTIEYFKTRI